MCALSEPLADSRYFAQGSVEFLASSMGLFGGFLLLAGEKALEVFGPVLLVTIKAPSNEKFTDL